MHLRWKLLLITAAIFGGLSLILSLPNLLTNRIFLDSYQYYAAFQVAISGGNPYDWNAMAGIENNLSPVPDTTIMMWNPPTFLVLLAPFMQFGFVGFVRLLLLFNLITPLLLVLWISAHDKKRDLPSSWFILGAYGFYPYIELVLWGQSTLFVLIGVVLLSQGLRSKNFWVQFVSAPFLIVKPHLVVPMLIGVAVAAGRTKNFKVLYALGLGTFFNLLLVEIYWPGALVKWLSIYVGAQRNDVLAAPFGWKTASLPHALSSFLTTPPEALALVFFALASLVAIWIGLRKFRAILDGDLCELVALSVLLAPFLWVYDMVLLLILQFDGLYQAFIVGRRAAKVRVALLMVLQCAALGLSQTNLREQNNFFWFPAVFLMLLGFTRLPSKYSNET